MFLLSRKMLWCPMFAIEPGGFNSCSCSALTEVFCQCRFCVTSQYFFLKRLHDLNHLSSPLSSWLTTFYAIDS